MVVLNGTCRFIGVDLACPMGLAGGGNSTYAYVGGNPVSNSTSQQWNQSRDAAAIALQEAASNVVNSIVNEPRLQGLQHKQSTT